MKALSIRQPWAWLICTGQKDIENRSWKLPSKMVGKRIYVHAGLRVDKEASTYRWRKDTGCIIGEVTITGCVTESGSPWFSKGGYGFTLTYPVLYEKPIPYKGRLGFFEVRPCAPISYGAGEQGLTFYY